ncbi:MAG: hypothetical protein ABSA39_18490 [Edaphobacter sp.]
MLVSLSILAEASDAGQRSHAVSELQALPAGITLPVQMGRTLRAGRSKPGTVFMVTTTQRVPVTQDSYLNRGAKVRGEIVASSAGDGTAAHPSVLTIRFTQLSYRGQTVPLVTRAVAAANLMYVDDTFMPTMGVADRGNNSASWTTRQVGGDVVARTGWVADVVGSGLRTVGNADYYGVYSLPVKLSDGGVVPQAMGVFSTTANGLYGYDTGARLESPDGLITITNPEKRAVIRNGDNLLLEVMPAR